MRIINSRNLPLNFGKHRDLSLKQIADRFPGYFCWLKRDKVIKMRTKKDQNWFNQRANTLNKRTTLIRTILYDAQDDSIADYLQETAYNEHWGY
jgi:hypothetical protein